MNFLISLLFPLFMVPNGPLKNEDVRSAFHSSLESEESLQFFIQNQGFPSTGLTKAYKGLSKAMMAEHAFFPHTKYQYFTAGRDMVEEAIDEDPLNAELRYARLLIQLNAPAFLGYAGKIEEDLKIVVMALESNLFTDEWKATFVRNLMAAEYIAPMQEEQLAKLL